MAQKRLRQSEWPRVKREPDGYTLAPDVYVRMDRTAAGPLRTGTVQNGVGPRGRAPQDASDYGMDRIVREFDPIGTSLRRNANPSWESPLISSNPAPRTTRTGSGSGRSERGPRPRGADRRSDSEKP